MLAGETNIEMWTKVRIKDVDDINFSGLNGITGIITHPFWFGDYQKGWVGVWFDEYDFNYGSHCNVDISNIEIIE